MTTLPELRAQLRAAEQRRDLHEAQRLFMAIQRETWRSVPRAVEADSDGRFAREGAA